MGCWFAFTALMVGDPSLLTTQGVTVDGSPSKIPSSKVTDEEVTSQAETLMNILLICSITNISGGAIRFLSSLFLLKSAEKVRFYFLLFTFYFICKAVGGSKI
jgi:hypothetical protein